MTTHDADEATDTTRTKINKTRGAGTGLYARTWSDDEPEPRPEHPAPTETARDLEPHEYPRTLNGLLRSLAPGWRLACAQLSGGHKPLQRAPWVGELSTFVLARFAHDTGVRAAIWWVGGRADGAATWHTCTDPDCHAPDPDHPDDVPAPTTTAGIRALLADPWP